MKIISVLFLLFGLGLAVLPAGHKLWASNCQRPDNFSLSEITQAYNSGTAPSAQDLTGSWNEVGFADENSGNYDCAGIRDKDVIQLNMAFAESTPTSQASPPTQSQTFILTQTVLGESSNPDFTLDGAALNIDMDMGDPNHFTERCRLDSNRPRVLVCRIERLSTVDDGEVSSTRQNPQIVVGFEFFKQ